MEQMEKKIEELFEILEHDSRIIEIRKYRQKLLENSDILRKIKKIQSLDIYSNEYKRLKLELFQNSDFAMYKQLENELNLLIMQINQKLKLLTDERSCHHANY